MDDDDEMLRDLLRLLTSRERERERRTKDEKRVR